MVTNTTKNLVFILEKVKSLYLSNEQSSSAMKCAQYANRRNKNPNGFSQELATNSKMIMY